MMAYDILYNYDIDKVGIPSELLRLGDRRGWRVLAMEAHPEKRGVPSKTPKAQTKEKEPSPSDKGAYQSMRSTFERVLKATPPELSREARPPTK
jgi:hypothetical protein